MRRIDKAREYWGDQFSCVIPGIVTNESYSMPICKNYHENDTSVGIFHLTSVTGDYTDYRKGGQYLLAKPPIGIYKVIIAGNCLPNNNLLYYSFRTLLIVFADANPSHIPFLKTHIQSLTKRWNFMISGCILDQPLWKLGRSIVYSQVQKCTE